MSNLNIANRTLGIMDNLSFLRSLNNECIDLIAIDPLSLLMRHSPEDQGRLSARPNIPKKSRCHGFTVLITTKGVELPA